VNTAESETQPSAVRADIDQDRGVLVGVAVGLTMLFLLQGLIAGAYQVATRFEGDALGPLRFAGFTQLMYVAPSVLLFVNRRCPKMALGAALVAGTVFVANIVFIIFRG